MTNSFKHSTKIYLNYEYSDYYLKELKKQNIINYHRGMIKEQRPLVGAILDSSLITASGRKLYDTKIIQCGNYYQMYKYSSKRSIKINQRDLNTKLIPLLKGLKNYKFKSNELKKIELRNINRSKFNLQRLVKANEKDFTTFITLTFEDNIDNVEYANKKFQYWRTYMKQKNKDFKYICISEFQKRGAIHYHLLTNIPYDSDLLLDELKLWSPKSKTYQIGKPLKSWKYGFSMVKKIDDINVVGYLTKYMTKDIDNRLFGYRKYTYSYNLNRPSVVYLNSEISKDYSYIFLVEKLYDHNYSKMYADKFNNAIYFTEYQL